MAKFYVYVDYVVATGRAERLITMVKKSTAAAVRRFFSVPDANGLWEWNGEMGTTPFTSGGNHRDYLIKNGELVYGPLPVEMTSDQMARLQTEALIENVKRSMPASLEALKKMSSDDQAKLLFTAMQAVAAVG